MIQENFTIDALIKNNKTIYNDKLTYTKKWFCQNCKQEITLENSKQRKCLICSNK